MTNYYELLPADSHKSFYGKCKVLDFMGEKILKSYKTEVLKVDRSGRLVRLWDGWSVTTQRHVNAFLIHIGRPDLQGKANWHEIPTVKELI